MSNEEEEVYREVRRDIIRRYYSGYLARDEYTEELEELDRRKYEGISGGGGGGDSTLILTLTGINCHQNNSTATYQYLRWA